MSARDLASLVVTYHRPGPLQRTLEALGSQSRPPAKILVIDNGRDAATADLAAKLADRSVEYLAPQTNLGPAGALHTGLSRLAAEGFELLHYTGDGEAPHPATLLEERMGQLEALQSADVGCLAGYGMRWDWRHGRRITIPEEELQDDLVDADLIAAAQPIFTRRSVLAGGLPTPQLFWGFEDYEQSLRIRGLGLRILVDPQSARAMRTVRMRQKQPGLGRWVPGLPAESLWRRYYLTRNIVYCMRRVFARPDLARREVLKQLAVTPFSLARGWRFARRRLGFVVAGSLDGYRGRLGPRFLPELVDGRYEETFERTPIDDPPPPA